VLVTGGAGSNFHHGVLSSVDYPAALVSAAVRQASFSLTEAASFSPSSPPTSMAGGPLVIDNSADPVSVEVPAEHRRQSAYVAGKGGKLLWLKMHCDHAVSKM
jgi:hypothetical protein